MITHALIEVTKESGEVVLSERHATELLAQEAFNGLEKIFYPNTYKTLTMNLSEYPEGRTGSVRLIAIDHLENRYERRELYRKP